MKKLFLFLLLLFGVTQPLQAATYYVANGGSAAVDCTAAQNPATPRSTVANILDNCLTNYSAGAGAGHIIEIADKTVLTESHFDRGANWPKGSSFASPFTIRGAAGGTIVWRPHNGFAMGFLDAALSVSFYVIVDNITFDMQSGWSNQMLLANANFIRFNNIKCINIQGALCVNQTGVTAGAPTGLEVLNSKFIDPNSTYQTSPQDPSYGYPIYVQGSNGIFDGNEFAQFPAYGIHIYNQLSAAPSGHIVRNNSFHDYGWAINCPSGDTRCLGRPNVNYGSAILALGANHKIYNNKIYNGVAGIAPYGGTGTVVYSNTMRSMSRTCIEYHGFQGQIIRNNICYPTPPGVGGVSGHWWDWDDPTGSGDNTNGVLSNNLCQTSDIGCSVVGDPQFVNPGAGDFQLNANSPAINAGFTLGAPYNVDFAGTSRPQGAGYDIGAYEFTPPAAGTRYVDNGSSGCSSPTDNDYNPATRSCGSGSSIVHDTIPGGLRALPIGSANTRLEIRSGNYTTTATYGNSCSDSYGGGTSWSDATIITNFAGETVTWNNRGMAFRGDLGCTPQYVIVQGDSRARFTMLESGSNNLSGVNFTSAVSNIRIQRTTIRNYSNSGIDGGGTVGARPTNIEILDNDIRNNGDSSSGPVHEHGIYPNCAANWTIDRNSITGNFGYGVHLYSATAGCHSNHRVSNNVIDEGGTSGQQGAGIIVAAGAGHIVFNNTIRGRTRFPMGIQVEHGTTVTAAVYSNTIYQTTTGIRLGAASINSNVRNNIIDSVTIAIDDAGTSTTKANNACASGTGCLITGNPLLVDPANGDFRIQSGSPVIDQGIALGSPYNVDIVGTSRPQGNAWDIGAYEFFSGTCTPTLVASYSADNTANDGTGTNHGTLGSGVTYTTGKYGQAWSFAGTGGITISDHNSLDFTSGFSLGMWVKAASITGERSLIFKNPLGAYVMNAANQFTCGASAIVGGFVVGGSLTAVCSSTPLTVGVFTYLEISYNPPNLILRRDGADVTIAQATATLDVTAGSLLIGTNVYNEHFSGEIDNVRLYNCGISLAQHITDMNTPLGAAVNAITIKLGSVTKKIGSGVNEKVGLAP